ncbi:MAG: prepilin-type N-terminal cleavage/methylation domain-containing protein [Pseudomonadota bacterium]
MKHLKGFSLIEMLTTLTLLSVLALAVMPVAQMSQRRVKEQELRHALFSIRKALDQWKTATDKGEIPAAAATASGYPPTLKILAEGIQTTANQPPRRFLRFIPRDPFAQSSDLPADQTWQLRSYISPAETPAPGEDVYDIQSKSSELGLNGIAYREW